MLEALAASETGALMRLCSWDLYEIGDTFSAENEGLKGRVVRDIAAEQGISPFDCLVDIVLADELRTILWPLPPDDDDASWALRQQVWADDRAILGGSDAGAHLDRMLGSNYPTRFLADCLRGRRLVPVERAVQMMTSVPAALFGLRDRGVLEVGAHGDVVVFDPETVDSELVTMVHDLPGGTPRLFAGSVGVEHVLVNGVEIVADGAPTEATPGKVLRSGRDTYTPALA
jgi:N-acyl-D-aspartate/D-glutamate deacylase